MSSLVWLASYPKSGNTWMRVFLANLMAGKSVDINAIAISESASSREMFDAAAGVEASDLTRDEIDAYRPAVFRSIVLTARSTLFLKAHDAFGLTPRGEPIFPCDASRGAVCIVRNPLDIAVSYAHHSGMSLEGVIDFMADEDARTGSDGDGLADQLPTRLTSWSSHVLSWADQSEMAVHIVRYEDMIAEPLHTFTNAAEFAGIGARAEAVEGALLRSSFSSLQSQERSRGFRERILSDRAFFREGKAGAWRNTLSESHVKRIVGRHGAVMQRFGYLYQDGRPIV